MKNSLITNLKELEEKRRAENQVRKGETEMNEKV